MRVLFYTNDDFDADPVLIGAAELGVEGEVVPSNDLITELLDETVIREPESTIVLDFVDGERYLAALPATFRGPYLVAKIDPEN